MWASKAAGGTLERKRERKKKLENTVIALTTLALRVIAGIRSTGEEHC